MLKRTVLLSAFFLLLVVSAGLQAFGRTSDVRAACEQWKPYAAAESSPVVVFIGHTEKGPVNKPTLAKSHSDFQRIFGGTPPGSLLSSAIRLFFENGGTSAYILSIAAGSKTPGIAELIGSARHKTGLHALSRLESFDLLAIPRTSLLGDVEAGRVINLAAGICENRRAFYIVDPPRNATAKSLAVWIKGIRNSPNAVVYFPNVRVGDPSRRSRYVIVPPSGAVAGVFARFETTHGVWKSPAGPEAVVRGADGPAQNLTNADISMLNPLGINCIRSIPSAGIVLWGARTLSQDTEWKYISIRRLTIFIEASVDEGTEWAVFEPNGEPAWAKARSEVGAFMDDLFRKGAFQGASADKAYFVKCDSETNTPADIANGVFNIVVGFAPLRPAEFVIVRIQKTAAPN